MDKIKQYEIISKKSGKGLIILTGSKLRLGVSLPCADLALNFDNVQSIDSNYQTMFRVLTERKNQSKKYGYYVDFNVERTTKFIYEYSMIYSNKMKKIKSTDDVKEQISNMYELFNFNGYSFTDATNLKQAVKMYQYLSKKLGLNEENLREMYLKNYERTFGKILLKYDLVKFKGINSIVSNIFKNADKVSFENKGKDKKGAEKAVRKPSNNNSNTQLKPNDNNTDEQEDNDEDNIDVIKNLRVLIPAIIALLAIFSSTNKDSSNHDLDCENLETLLD